MPSLIEPGESSRGDARLYDTLGTYFDDGDDTDERRSTLLAGHPELAQELALYFAGQDRVHRFLQSSRSAHGTKTEDPTEANPGGASVPPFDSFSLDDYELIGKISEGGMGIVYRARRRGLDRTVALKVLRPDRATASERIRFQNEAQAIADLDHPNIVPIYDVGPDFFAMKLIPGGSLAESLHRYAKWPREAAQLMVKLARAVHHAHERGILHRDLKPSNVLLDERGEPFVGDFGLAKRLGLNLELTESGQLLGTLNYMAPEQATSHAKDVTTRADIWGLGTILYALLTGRPPFLAESAASLIVQLQEKDPDRPTSLNRRVNPELEAICLKCLEKEPGKRYTSAAALADDLDRFLEHRPIKARRPTAYAQVSKWVRRHPSIVIATLATLLITSVVLTLAIVLIAGEQVATQAALKRARDEEESAKRYAATAQIESERADHRLVVVLQGLQSLLLRLGDKTLPDIPEFRELRRSVEEHARRTIEEFIVASSRDPKLLNESIVASIHLAELYFQSGRLEECSKVFAHAIALCERLMAMDPSNPGYPSQVGTCHNMLGLELCASGMRTEAIEHFEQARRAFLRVVELDPESFESLRRLRWFLVICPEARFRDPDRVLELTAKMIEKQRNPGAAQPWDPSLSPHWLVRGIAFYRKGDFASAIDALERPLHTQRPERGMLYGAGDIGLGWFFLAMAYHQTGDRARALDCYRTAVRVMDTSRPRDAELLNVRAEATAQLDLTDQPAPTAKEEYSARQHLKP
jgi:serine/threonine protein kinase/tetratricopeptide (TPR) repeat protein